MPKKGNGIYQRRDGRYEAIHYYGISVTLNRYAHSFDEQKRQAMKKIAAHLSP